MTGDLGRFDGAVADLLPGRDVGAAERVRPQALEVATFRACGLVERVADRRIAHWPVRGPLLIKDPALGSGVFGRGFLAEPLDRIPDAKHAPAVLGLWAADMLVPDALFDLDRPGVQVHVLPLQAKDLGDARACGGPARLLGTPCERSIPEYHHGASDVSRQLKRARAALVAPTWVA